MKEYGYLQALYKSFYSPKLYRDVAWNWGADVVFYLFLLTFICWGVLLLKYQPIIGNGLRNIVHKMGEQVPEMEIVNGEIKTPENKPYFIIDPDTKETIAIIDTSGEYGALKNGESKPTILVTKKQIFYVESETNDIHVKDIPETLTMVVDPSYLKEKIIFSASWLWLLLLPLRSLYLWIGRLLQVLFYAALGKLFAYMTHIPLRYGQVFKLSAVALTPPIIIVTAVAWFDVYLRYSAWIIFAIAIGYLIFAIRANRPTS